MRSFHRLKLSVIWIIKIIIDLLYKFQKTYFKYNIDIKISFYLNNLNFISNIILEIFS